MQISIFIIFLINLAILQVQCTDGMCTFRQVASNQPIPVKLYPDGQGMLSPYALNTTLTNYNTTCPDVDANHHCCGQAQIDGMPENYEQIDITFGSGNGIGGCDFCAANLKKFYCHFACDPNQSNWVYADDDLITVQQDYYPFFVQALNVTVYVNGSMICDMFDSCQKTSYVGAMQTAQGFMQFQGTQGVSQGNVLVNFYYQQNGSFTPHYMEMNNCTSKVYTNVSQDGSTTDQWGYPIKKNCSCNNCQLACGSIDISAMTQPPSAFRGFDGWFVLYLFCGMIGLTIIMAFLRGLQKRNYNKYKKTDDQLIQNHDNSRQQQQIFQ